MKTMGERIKALREKSGWTQDQLAMHLGMNRANISNYERNVNTNIPSDTLSKLADLFKTSIDYLMCRTDDSEQIADSPEWASLRDGKDLKKFLSQTEIMFDGVPMTNEEKARIQGFMESMFWDAKTKNKRNIKPD